MTLLHEAVEAKKLDVRVIERHVQKGLLDPTNAQKAMETLPDDADNAEWVNIEELAGTSSEGSNNGSDS